MVKVLKGGLTAAPGFLAAGVRAGLKRRGPDVMLLVSKDGPVPAAGVFTSNLVKGAPIPVTAKHLRDGKLGAVIVNSGCANAYTGKRGLQNARTMAELAGSRLGLKASDVGVASTGLIGSQLPMDRIERGIKRAVRKLSGSRPSGRLAAKAIMTTDTKPKEFAVKVRLEDGTSVTVGGIAKGAGMIKPKLQATMLAFITTDASIAPAALKAALRKSVGRSFNMVNIDQETSTSDMVLVLANGRAGNLRIVPGRPSERFQEGLDRVTTELARQIARDGEGASHLIEVRVSGARNENNARKAALAVAGSNLVKAAVFGRDPNWGRVVTALGYSGASFDPDKNTLALASGRRRVVLVKRGTVAPASALTRAGKVLRGKEIEIQIDLAAGRSEATAWGCDLTYDYVRINSQYRT